MPELIAQQPAAGCSVPLPQEGPCPTAGGSAGAGLCPAPDPQTQPIPRVLLLVGGLPVGSFSPLALLAGNLPLSLLAWCPLSVAGALPPVCSRASFPFREKLDGPCFRPACSTSPSGFFSIFSILFCFWRLKPPASPSRVCQWWLLESCTGAGWRGKPKCCPAQGEPEGVVTASVLSCSKDLISAGTGALQQAQAVHRQGLGHAAGLSRAKGEEAEGNFPKNVDSLLFFFFTPDFYISCATSASVEDAELAVLGMCRMDWGTRAGVQWETW